MKVVAQRGGPDMLLVETRTVEGVEWGRIWNVPRREMSQEQPVASIARFGYWEAYTGPDIDPSDYEGVYMMEARKPR